MFSKEQIYHVYIQILKFNHTVSYNHRPRVLTTYVDWLLDTPVAERIYVAQET